MLNSIDDQTRTAELSAAHIQASETGPPTNDLRGRLDNDVSHLRAELITAQRDLTELMRDTKRTDAEDEIDSESQHTQVWQASRLVDNLQRLLDQAERVVLRIDSDAYGVCELCNEQIDPLRLEALPHATLCLSCKKVKERRDLVGNS